MKSYIVDRSSSTPHLNEMPTNVEKIYQTKEAAEAALANGDIADGEFVSTVDTVEDTGDKFDKSYLSYSTEETLTGGTWIDGKPIYRKVLTGLSYSFGSSSWNNTDIDMTGIDTLVNIMAYNSGTPQTGFYTKIVSNKLVVYCIDSWSWNGPLVLEYTKQ